MDIGRLVRGRIDVGIARFNDRSSLERDVILDPAIFDVSGRATFDASCPPQEKLPHEYI